MLVRPLPAAAALLLALSPGAAPAADDPPAARQPRVLILGDSLSIGYTPLGREMLKVLVERQFPISEVVALASTRSVGSEVSFGDGVLKVKALDYYDFKGTDIALMSAGGEIAKQWAPKIAGQGCMVIDNSSAWRMDRQVPLVVPEVNADALNDIPKGIIANPNCSTAQLVVALKPLQLWLTAQRTSPRSTRFLVLVTSSLPQRR